MQCGRREFSEKGESRYVLEVRIMVYGYFEDLEIK